MTSSEPIVDGLESTGRESPERSPHRQQPRLRFGRAVASGLAVLAVVTVASVIRATNHTGAAAGGRGDARSEVVGNRWRVTHIQDARGMFPVPSTFVVELGFTRDGFVIGSDSVNALQGKVAFKDGGYIVSGGGGTLAGYAGPDLARKRAIAVVDAMFFNRPVVAMDVRGDELTLRRNETLLVLRKAGSQPNLRG